MENVTEPGLLTECRLDDPKRIEMFEELNNQRRGGRLCDVFLIADEQKFSAHRNVLAATSPYFRGMFEERNFAEGASAGKEIYLQCISGDALREILELVYTGRMRIDLDNVHDIIAASDHLLFESVLTLCVKFCTDVLHSKHSLDEVLRVRRTAQIYSLYHLLKEANNVINTRFREIGKTETFQLLSVEELQSILVSDDIIEPDEVQFWRSIQRWFSYDIQNRAKYAYEICKFIRFPLIDAKVLYAEVVDNQIMKNSPQCQELMQETMKYQLLPDMQSLNQSIRTKPRITSNMNIIYFISGESHFMCYVPDYKHWYSLQAPPFFKDKSYWDNRGSNSLHYTILTVNGMPYAFGQAHHEQEVGNFEMKCLYRYNLGENTWTPCRLPEQGSKAATLIQGNNNLYACFRNEIMQYDERLDTWESIAQENIGPFHFVVSDDGGFFFYNLYNGICHHIKIGHRLSATTSTSTQILSPSLFVGDILSITKLNRHEILIFIRSPSRISRKIFNLKTNMWCDATLYSGASHSSHSSHSSSSEVKVKSNLPQCLQISELWDCVCDRDRDTLYILARKSGLGESDSSSRIQDGVLPFFSFDMKSNTWTRLPGLTESYGTHRTSICIHDGHASMATCDA